VGRGQGLRQTETPAPRARFQASHIPSAGPMTNAGCGLRASTTARQKPGVTLLVLFQRAGAGPEWPGPASVQQMLFFIWGLAASAWAKLSSTWRGWGAQSCPCSSSVYQDTPMLARSRHFFHAARPGVRRPPAGLQANPPLAASRAAPRAQKVLPTPDAARYHPSFLSLKTCQSQS